MSEILYANMAYCSICDQYFPSEDAKLQHIQLSPNHPRCDACDKRFANKNALRNHLVFSPRHNYCVVCERDFRTPGGLRIHMEYASVHRDDTDDDDPFESDDESVDNLSDGWEDTLGATAFPNESGSDGSSVVGISEYALERASDDETPPLDIEYYDLSGEFSDYEHVSFVEESDSGDSESRDEDDSGEEDASAPRIDITNPREHSPALGQAHIPAEMESCSNASTARPTRALSANYFTCPLCLEAPKSSSATRCGHVFCTRCIHTALETKKQCPVCRMPAYERHLRKLYLGNLL